MGGWPRSHEDGVCGRKMCSRAGEKPDGVGGLGGDPNLTHASAEL